MSENRVHEQEEGWYMHGHPGHTVFVPRDGRWTFNGDMVKPTFSPSILEGGTVKYDTEPGKHGHHIFVRDGVVQYLSDRRCPCCEGQAEFYPIPPWEEDQ